MDKNIWLKNYPKEVPYEIDPQQLISIPKSLEKALKQYADTPLLSCSGETLTYRQFESLSRQFAAFLQQHLHAKKGDRLGIMLPNLLPTPIAVMGGQRAGLMTVGFNPLYTSREFIYQANDAQIETLITFEGALPVVKASYEKTSLKRIILVNCPEVSGFNLPVFTFQQAMEMGKELNFEEVEINSHDIALLQYTGGTTGISKGAMIGLVA